MDQIALVTEHIDDGRKLIDRLVQDGVKITAAGWLKTTDYSGSWYLFIASPIADNDRKAYMRVLLAIRQLPQPFWVDPFDVMLIGPKSPLAKRMREIYRRYPAKDGIRYAPRIADSADLGIEDSFIYPPPFAIPAV